MHQAHRTPRKRQCPRSGDTEFTKIILSKTLSFKSCDMQRMANCDCVFEFNVVAHPIILLSRENQSQVRINIYRVSGFKDKFVPSARGEAF